MLDELCLGDDRILFTHFRIPSHSLDVELVSSMANEDVLTLLKCVPRFKEIKVYIKVDVSLVDQHMMERGVASNDEKVELFPPWCAASMKEERKIKASVAFTFGNLLEEIDYELKHGSEKIKEKLSQKMLYHLEQEKDCLIIDCIVNGQWKWNWSREDIGVRNTAYLMDMLLEISQVDLNAIDDHYVWTMAKDGIFSVEESRRIIDSKLLPSLVPYTSWDKTLPHKVNIFIWRLALDRLPHSWNLSARGIDIPSISCPSCNGNVESSSHIFFDCDFAQGGLEACS
ncbi:RNA-directed DNA polymerase, eukaryota [Tanacetum coccineum]